MEPDFPRTLDAVTPQWLTQVLQTEGGIGDAVVVTFEGKPLGAGAGFQSAMQRLALTYSDPALLDMPWLPTLKSPQMKALDHANARGVALFRTWTDRTMPAIADLDAGAVQS